MRTTTVTIDERYEPEYRPETYWDDETAMLANIKGQWRRERIATAVADGSADEVPVELFGDSLVPPVRASFGAIHPWLMGGEYLPGYLPGEVEIARVTLQSTTMDVISVRARPAEDGIRYRVVGEYEDQEGWGYRVPFPRSERPLAFAELVELIDGTMDEASEWTGLVRCQWEYVHRENGDPQEAARFATASSVHYPQLAGYYADEGESWCMAKLREWFLGEEPESDWCGYAGLWWAIWMHDAEFARDLLARGAAVDERTEYPGRVSSGTPSPAVEGGGAAPEGLGSGLTVLHLAAFCGATEIARVLLDHGADPNAADACGNTPLMRAGENAEEMTRLLLEAGARSDRVNAAGMTALHRAASLGEVRTLRLLLDAGADPSARSAGGTTPLHYAVTWRIARALLAAGADPHARDDGGCTPLHYALRTYSMDLTFNGVMRRPPTWGEVPRTVVPMPIPTPGVVKALVEAGADVNAVNAGGFSPLDVAATKQAARLLVAAGAGPGMEASEPSSGRGGAR